MDDARAAEKRIAAGEARPLEGIPFTAKDLAAIADGPTNLGSRAFQGQHVGVDAGVVSRLRSSGAILIGTTTASEFGNRPTTESALFGATRNPWNLERTSGGSSGGAAVSAALGIASLNQASDGGGSIRIPAACCGVYGLKPARARITLRRRGSSSAFMALASMLTLAGSSSTNPSTPLVMISVAPSCCLEAARRRNW